MYFYQKIHPMETISHFFASLDIFQILINAFPSIFNPLINGLENLFILLFKYVKQIIESYPGLIGGMFFTLTLYSLFSLGKKLRKLKVK